MARTAVCLTLTLALILTASYRHGLDCRAFRAEMPTIGQQGRMLRSACLGGGTLLLTLLDWLGGVLRQNIVLWNSESFQCCSGASAQLFMPCDSAVWW